MRRRTVHHSQEEIVDPRLCDAEVRIAYSLREQFEVRAPGHHPAHGDEATSDPEPSTWFQSLAITEAIIRMLDPDRDHPRQDAGLHHIPVCSTFLSMLPNSTFALALKSDRGQTFTTYDNIVGKRFRIIELSIDSPQELRAISDMLHMLHDKTPNLREARCMKVSRNDTQARPFLDDGRWYWLAKVLREHRCFNSHIKYQFEDLLSWALCQKEIALSTGTHAQMALCQVAYLCDSEMFFKAWSRQCMQIWCDDIATISADEVVLEPSIFRRMIVLRYKAYAVIACGIRKCINECLDPMDFDHNYGRGPQHTNEHNTELDRFFSHHMLGPYQLTGEEAPLGSLLRSLRKLPIYNSTCPIHWNTLNWREDWEPIFTEASSLCTGLCLKCEKLRMQWPYALVPSPCSHEQDFQLPLLELPSDGSEDNVGPWLSPYNGMAGES